MFDLTFLVNFINRAINMITSSVMESVVNVEDQIMNLPDEEDIGIKMTEAEYNNQVNEVKTKLENIETTATSIETLSEAVEQLSTAFGIVHTIAKIIMIVAKLSVAAVPGGIAVLAAQEVKDIGQKMMEQSGSAVASLKNKAQDIGTEAKSMVDKKNSMLDKLD